MPLTSFLPTAIVTFGPCVADVAAIEWSEVGTTMEPMSLPKEVWELEELVKPLMNEGGMFTTDSFNMRNR